MTRKTLTWIAAAVLLLAAAYSVYWWIVAGRLDDGIDAWAAAERQSGLTLEFERGPVRGYPLAFRTTFAHPHIAGVMPGGSFDWRGPDVEASLAPFDFRTITLNAPGLHQLDLGQGPAKIDAGRMKARLNLTRDGLLSGGSARFRAMRLTFPDGRIVSASSGSVALTLPLQSPKTDRDPLLQFSSVINDLQLPRGTELLTEDPLTEAAVAGTIKGPVPPAAALHEALAMWRDQGGTVELLSFKVEQATLTLSGTATIALDADLQPIVAADLKARGLGPTVDLLEKQKRILPADALKMKLFVQGAERDAPGGGKEVATGLTVQGNYLSWGPFKLAQLPRIAWP